MFYERQLNVTAKPDVRMATGGVAATGTGQFASEAMIKVTFDPSRKLVRAVMSGLLTVEDVEQFSRDEQEAVRAMHVGSGEFLLLVETRGQVVQNQDVVNAFQKLMLHSPLKARRVATVRTGALPTLQTRRIATVRDSARVFESVEDAEAWLFG